MRVVKASQRQRFVGASTGIGLAARNCQDDHKRMRTDSGGYRRDHLRALVAASSAKMVGFGVPSFCTELARRYGCCGEL
jgi:hypothetical protein